MANLVKSPSIVVGALCASLRLWIAARSPKCSAPSHFRSSNNVLDQLSAMLDPCYGGTAAYVFGADRRLVRDAVSLAPGQIGMQPISCLLWRYDNTPPRTVYSVSSLSELPNAGTGPAPALVFGRNDSDVDTIILMGAIPEDQNLGLRFTRLDVPVRGAVIYSGSASTPIMSLVASAAAIAPSRQPRMAREWHDASLEAWSAEFVRLGLSNADCLETFVRGLEGYVLRTVQQAAGNDDKLAVRYLGDMSVRYFRRVLKETQRHTQLLMAAYGEDPWVRGFAQAVTVRFSGPNKLDAALRHLEKMLVRHVLVAMDNEPARAAKRLGIPVQAITRVMRTGRPMFL